MKQKLLVLSVALLLLGSNAFAQRRGSSGMQGGQSGQGQRGSGAQPGQGQPADSGSGTGGGDQQRIRIHATDRQQQQLKSCTQSTERIRTRTREMSRLGKGTLTAEQAQVWREQIQNELQTMNQNYDDLMASLTEEQKSASQDKVKKVEESRSQLLEVADLLEDELIAPELDQNEVQEKARKTEKAAAKLKKTQTELSELFTPN